MTTCLNYMQHMMKLSKSHKKPKHLNPNRGGGGEAATPIFFILLWSICGLYCRLYMAYVQLVYNLNVPIYCVVF